MYVPCMAASSSVVILLVKLTVSGSCVLEERLDCRGREGFDSCFICAQGLEGKKDTVNVNKS